MRKGFLLIFLLLALMADIASSQERPGVAKQRENQMAVFAPVTTSFRYLLNERLKSFVAFIRSKDWNRVYELRYKPDIKDERREDFVEREEFFARGKGASHLLAFEPTATMTSPIGVKDGYMIEGCMRVRQKGRIRSYQGSVETYLVDGNWFFSDVNSIVPAIDAPPKPCNTKDRK